MAPGPHSYQAAWRDSPRTRQRHRAPTDTRQPGEIPREHANGTGPQYIPGTLARFPENTPTASDPNRYQAPWRDSPRTRQRHRTPTDTRHPGEIPREHANGIGPQQIPGTLARFPENTPTASDPNRYQAPWRDSPRTRQ